MKLRELAHARTGDKFRGGGSKQRFTTLFSPTRADGLHTLAVLREQSPGATAGRVFPKDEGPPAIRS